MVTITATTPLKVHTARENNRQTALLTKDGSEVLLTLPNGKVYRPIFASEAAKEQFKKMQQSGCRGSINSVVSFSGVTSRETSTAEFPTIKIKTLSLIAISQAVPMYDWSMEDGNAVAAVSCDTIGDFYSPNKIDLPVKANPTILHAMRIGAVGSLIGRVITETRDGIPKPVAFEVYSTTPYRDIFLQRLR